ncbi:Ger(x)C family spore germination protein [Salinibacillus xinjiangensis]|uniref:Ger(X)C family spore germination protein n=1 Tax=Salinibacillus xinjiangensis TaxID=1229268 RepID=A0A6G1X425_9BACI|nr:Ger(x)C family spore germination protein [Salinibacillus xinjiangensis]MRG85697.1 Ger(x)C family spore germination protein [Salinibacillus xinjiangensis]
MKKIKVMITLCLLLLSGCSASNEIVDELALISAIGFDLTDDNKLQGTITVPNFQSDKTVTTEVFTETGTLIQEIEAKLNSEANQPLAIGKLEVILYNEKVAKQGIRKMKDVFVRDPSVGSRARMAVVEGNTKDVLTREYWTHGAGLYLAEMFDQNFINGRMPQSNIHLFTFALYSKGMDPFLPLVSVGKMVKINQIALFKEDKYVGKLPEDKTFTFHAMKDNFQDATYMIKKEQGEVSAAVNNIMSTRTVDFGENIKDPKITINIRLEGILREFKTEEEVDKQKVNKIEKQMEDQMEQEAKEIIQTLQELNVDPLGLGNKYRGLNRNFDEKKWDEMYKDLDITANVNVIIREFGIRR